MAVRAPNVIPLSPRGVLDILSRQWRASAEVLSCEAEELFALVAWIEDSDAEKLTVFDLVKEAELRGFDLAFSLRPRGDR